MSKRKLAPLERRADFLRARVAGGDADGVDLSYDKAELSSLLWAIPRLQRPVEAIEALRELSDMYTHAWDLVDGGLMMMKGSVEVFEKAHARALKVLKSHDAAGESSK